MLISHLFVSSPGFTAAVQYDDATLAIRGVLVINSGPPLTLVVRDAGGQERLFAVATGANRTVLLAALGLSYTAGVARLGLPTKSYTPSGVELGTR